MTTTQKTAQFGALQIAIILLTVATAVIHLVLGVSILRIGGPPMFILNGIGYLALLFALYLPQLRKYQNFTRWALIGYTAVTIVAWAVITGFDLTNPTAIITKLIEIALIACLFIEGRK